MPEETKQDDIRQADVKQDDIGLQERLSQEAAQGSEQKTDAAPAAQAETPSLEARLAALEAERDEYKDLLLRKAADFENFRRQKEREMSALIKFADKNLIKNILPILDDLERVIANGEKFLANNPDAKIYVDGVKLVHQKLLKTLEARQVKRMETLGKKFDHNFHEALTQMPKADVEPDTIVEEFEAGYTMHDEVIRHAKVVVSKPIE